MGIFLAYLLGVFCISLALYGLRHYTRGFWLPTLIVNWLVVVTYLSLGIGILYTVFRYVKRKW